tara:strand:- start:311 stop:580 length:270 start_codon:yes stop_codon:yes gene_type:complete
MIDKYKGSKGRYLNGKMIDNYMNMQVEVKLLREKTESLLATLSEEARTIDEWCAVAQRLQNRNDFLEEIVALLQEQGIDIEQEGFPRWE